MFEKSGEEKVKYLYIWKDTGHITDRCHASAGVCVIADSLESARRLIKEYKPDTECFSEIVENPSTDTDSPDFTCTVDYLKDKVFIFPDAGCC